MDFKYSAGDDDYVQDVTVRQQPISGLISSVLFLFGMPLLVFIVPWLKTYNLDHIIPHFASAIILVIIAIVWWAAGIVTCVSEIAHYHSRTAEAGLFIFLVTPFMWAGAALLGVGLTVYNLYT